MPQKPGAPTERQARIEAEREAKLAKALRANLRRRKVEPKRGAGGRMAAEPVETDAESADGDCAGPAPLRKA